MSELVPADVVSFSFKGQPVRSVTVDGLPWFVIADLAKILGYRDAANAARVLRDHQQGYSEVSTPGGPQQMRVCSEQGLYRLILRSNAKNADEVQDWVTAAPLPPSCVGCLRRVQALQRIGHPLADIAHAADYAPAAVKVALRRGRVIDHLAFALDRAYRRMQHIPGGSKPATAWAASRANASPAAWDGVDIDDPAARPLGVIRPRGHHAADGTCTVCGTGLTPGQVRRHWVTCADDDCRRTARSRRDHTRRQARKRRTTPVLPSRRCLWSKCGKTFTPGSGRQFHCTTVCREKAKADSRPARRAAASTSRGREVAA